MDILLAKFLSDRVYFWGIFYATGYRAWRGLPHTPVTSLRKYPPPPGVKEKSNKIDLFYEVSICNVGPHFLLTLNLVSDGLRL